MKLNYQHLLLVLNLNNQKKWFYCVACGGKLKKFKYWDKQSRLSHKKCYFQLNQKDTELLSVKAIVREFTDNVFSFDSRFFISLKYLVTKPGFLTTEYWAGRRTKYLPPLRIYLVLSVF